MVTSGDDVKTLAEKHLSATRTGAKWFSQVRSAAPWKPEVTAPPQSRAFDGVPSSRATPRYLTLPCHNGRCSPTYGAAEFKVRDSVGKPQCPGRSPLASTMTMERALGPPGSAKATRSHRSLWAHSLAFLYEMKRRAKHSLMSYGPGPPSLSSMW